ncbi:MAG: lipoyl synthase, partial [Desulfovibrionales bacterium]
AEYERSIQLLERAASSSTVMTKSGLMVGVGETDREVFRAIDDLAEKGCGMVTIGQYLQPSRNHYPVQRYVHPSTFALYREHGMQRGIPDMFCGPLIRSSYHAEEHI